VRIGAAPSARISSRDPQTKNLGLAVAEAIRKGKAEGQAAF